MPSKMQQTVALGADFWNDSCDLRELGHAVKASAKAVVLLSPVLSLPPELAQ